MGEQGSVIFESRPTLRNPYVVCGLDGWINGGNVARGGIQYLAGQFRAVKFAEMQTSRYHIYQIPGIEGLRPIFKMDDGLITEAHFPRDEFYYALNPASDHDLIFFAGTEPSLNWEEYADTVAGVARDFGAKRLYALGGILDRTPHTREPRITCTCTDAGVKDEMSRCSVSFSSRQGAATINQMLLYACKKRGLEGAAFTVRVSYYPEFNIAFDYSPKAIRAVLSRLGYLMRLNLKFDELDDGIEQLDRKLDSLRRQNPEFNTYLSELEKDYVEMPFREPLDISPNEAIRLAEELLRGNKDQRRQE